MNGHVTTVAFLLGCAGPLSAQITGSPIEIQIEKTQSGEVVITSPSSGQEINAVCFDFDKLGVAPESKLTNSSNEAEFSITCKVGDEADYGTFRRGTTDEQERIDVNCLNSPFVFINEFSYDDEGPDDREFVELYNRSFSPVNISGWVLASFDSAGGNKCYHVPPNTKIPARGYYVFGSPSVPNVDQVVGVTDLWENDNEALVLMEATRRLGSPIGRGRDGYREPGGAGSHPWSQYRIVGVVDTIVYEAHKGVWDPSLAESEGIWGELVSIDGQETSWSRIWDGRDTKNNGADFALRPATPGASNNLARPPYADVFDTTPLGTSLAEWHGTFADPVVIDPAVVNAFNPNPISVSPQGGRAAVFWNPAGGGSAMTHLDQLIGGAVFEAWVYLDSSLLPGGQFDSWSVGFGTTGYDAPFASGIPRDHAGVTWTYIRTSGGAVLALIDHNDGGVGPGAITTPTILGSIAITAANDGWQRLRLEVDRSHALGSLGGTFGRADGTVVSGSIANNFSARSIFVSYTESVADPASRRPFTADAISIDWSTSLVHKYGDATPTSAGTPMLGTNSPPTIGSSVFGLELRGLVPNGSLCLGMGASRDNVALVGGLPGSRLLIGGPFVFIPLSASASGTAFYSPGVIPPGVLGMSCFWQIFDPDPISAPPGLLGCSMGLETRFGS